MKRIVILTVCLMFVAVGAYAETMSWTGVTKYTDGSAIPSGKTITYTVKSGASASGSFATEGTTTSTSRAVTPPA
ncbi:MAG: hypothetical protein ACWGQW_18250, partial [bacterium]